MNKKKLLALLMALVMTFSLVPVTALALDAEGPDSPSGLEENPDILLDEDENVAQIGDEEFETLAAAINAAESGDTIKILNGTWGADAIGTRVDAEWYNTTNGNRFKSLTIEPAEGATVTFTSNVILGYDDSSTTNAKIIVRNIAFESAVLSIGSYVDVTVEGCTFTGAPNESAGTLVIRDTCCENHKTNDTYPDSSVIVRNCIINGSSAGAPGIRLRNTGDVTLDKNTIENTKHNGILIEENDDADSTARKDITITNNTIKEWNADNNEEGGRAIRLVAAAAASGSVNINDNYFIKATTGLDTPDFVKIAGKAAGVTVDLDHNFWNGMALGEVSGNASMYKVVNDAPAVNSVIAYVAQIIRDEAVAGSYETLDAAVTAASAGDTVKLLQDITYGTDKEVTIWEKAVNLDLNGHILTTHSTKSVTLSNDGYKASAVCYSIPLNSTGNVTISNGTIKTAYGAGVYADNPGLTLTLENVTINAGQTGVQSTAEYTSAVRITGGAKVIINSGTYTSPANALTVSNSGGEFVVNDGTFSGKVFISYNNPATTKSITINGGKFSGTFEKKAGTITINGGVFTNDAKTSAASVATLGEGKIWTNNSDSETSASYPYTVGVPVAEFGGTQYTKLADAIAAANVNGGIVTLLRNYDMEANEPCYGYTSSYLAQGESTPRNNMIVIGDNVTFDLGNHTLSNLFNNTFKVTGNNVEVRNGTMNVGQLYYSDLNGKAYTSENDKTCSYVMYVSGASNFVVNNLGTYGGINVTNSTATINDLQFSGTKFYAVCSQDGADVTINGGTYNKAITGATSSMFWVDSGSSMKITGGRFEKGSGVSFFVKSSDYIAPIVTGGVFNFDPSNIQNKNCVADGYEAVQLTGDNNYGDEGEDYNGWYKVGKITTTELHQESGSDDTRATYSAQKVVKDGEGNALTTAQNTVTVTVTANQDDTSDKAPAAISNVKDDALQEVIAAAVNKAGDVEDATAEVEITVAKNQMNTGTTDTVTYEVHPEAIIKVTGQEDTTVKLTNDQIDGTFTFKLNVSSIAHEGDYVRIDHMENNAVLDSKTYRVGDDECVVISDITRFSIFVGEKVNTETDDFKYLGASLRRRVEINQDNIVVNSCTDMRFGFVLKNYNSANEYCFQWKKEGGTWSSPVVISNSKVANTTDGQVASLVITNIPVDFFDTTITARIYKNVEQNALEGDAMSVKQVANAIITKYKDNDDEKQWVDYATYLTTQSGSYTVTYGENGRVNGYNYQAQ